MLCLVATSYWIMLCLSPMPRAQSWNACASSALAVKHEMITDLITAAMGIATVICFAVIILF